MAASSHVRWVRNLSGAKDLLVKRGKFQAGVTQAVKKGEILILTGGYFVPVTADTAMAGTIAIANEDINSGDLAGYYEILVPRADDVFEFDLATASAIVVGAALYFSSSEAFATSGTNIMAYSEGQVHYPDKQGHMSVGDGSSDAGTTIASTSKVQVIFKAAVSYRAAISA